MSVSPGHVVNSLPFSQARAGGWGARLTLVNATRLRLSIYEDPFIEINGQVVSLIDNTLLLNAVDETILADGTGSGSGAAASTFYYVYAGNGLTTLEAGTPSLRFSLVAPAPNGYLGTTGDAANFRLAGYCYVNASTQFQDDETARHVISYYYRLPKSFLVRPGYVDNNTNGLSAAKTNVVWALANGGVDDTVSFISDGVVPIFLCGVLTMLASATGAFGGIGIDFGTAALVPRSTYYGASAILTSEASFTGVLDAGVHTASLVMVGQAGGTTIVWDIARVGAAEDPCMTYLHGWMLG